MNDLPPQRPLPEALRDRMWADIEPRLEAPAHGRLRSLRAPLAVAASVIVVALGIVIALPQIASHNLDVATGGLDPLVRECVRAGHNVPDPGSWRPGARIDLDSQDGFLVIRTDKTAAVCVLENGHGNGILGDDAGTLDYGKLTAARPFAYLDSMNYLNGDSVHFGITTADVTGVSLIGPDNSVSPGIAYNGTFIVRTKIAENSNQANTNYVHATLANGKTVNGPLRN